MTDSCVQTPSTGLRLGIMLFDGDESLVYVDGTAQELLCGERNVVLGEQIKQIFPEVWMDDASVGTCLWLKHTLVTFYRVDYGQLKLLALVSTDKTLRENATGHGRHDPHGVDLQFVLDNVLDEVYVTDGQGNTLFANKACEKLYGVPSSYLIGRNVRELEKEGIFFPAITPKVLSERSPVVVVQDTSGGRKIMASANPVFDGSGRISKIVTVSRDVTQFYQFQMHVASSEDLVNRYFQQMDMSAEIGCDQGQPVFADESMRKIAETVRRVAQFDSTVLFIGESGTGKDTLAELLVQASPRVSRPLIKVNCGAIPDNLIESELFGYESGAFTGARRGGKVGIVELANHGSLLLSEIDCLPLHLQAKLLHLIQDREFVRVGGTATIQVDIRILATSNRDLADLVKTGAFRQDLYYRLNVIPIRIPPLRQRPKDLRRLIDYFVRKVSDRYGVKRAFSPAAVDILEQYHWPGNVRELENVVERCMVTAASPIIQPTDLPDELCESPCPKSVTPLNPIQAAEKETLARALEQCGSTRKAAQYLGISQSTVVRRMRRYGITADKYR